MITPIRSGWDSYRDGIVPKEAGEVQVEECRRAFYAGAWSMFQLSNMIGEPTVSEAKGVEILEAVEAECRAFVKELSQPDPERN